MASQSFEMVILNQAMSTGNNRQTTWFESSGGHKLNESEIVHSEKKIILMDRKMFSGMCTRAVLA